MFSLESSSSPNLIPYSSPLFVPPPSPGGMIGWIYRFPDNSCERFHAQSNNVDIHTDFRGLWHNHKVGDGRYRSKAQD